MLELRGLQRLHVGPIDLRVDDGCCVAIEGRSGSGKSVLLRMVADLDPHAGQALLDGVACASLPAPQWRRRVAYVPAESGWWDEQVRPHFPAAFDLAAWLPRLGLQPSQADAPVARLSTGERQRLALLRALAHGPRALLLDEPTSGLDRESRDLAEAVLRGQLAQGVAILLVTHDPELAQRLAVQRWRMADGRLQPITGGSAQTDAAADAMQEAGDGA
jgi:ABC-type multidrug transport system ATPase subunit